MKSRQRIYELFLTSAGYSTKSLEQDSRESTQPIVLAGATVIAACAVAAANWFCAGYTAAESCGTTTAVSVGALAAGLGVAIVFTVDRTAVYQMDTQSSSSRWGRAAALLAARVAVVGMVSLVSVQAVAPKLFASDLREQALKMQEQSDSQRNQALHQQSSIERMTTIGAEAQRELVEEQNALGTVPENIATMERRGQTCLANFAAQKRALEAREKASKTTDLGARARLENRKADCVAEVIAARQAHEAYIEEHTRKREKAASRKAEAESAALEEAKEINQKLQVARSVEKENLTQESSVVFDALLATSASARIKWYSCVALVMLLELLALWTKLLSEKSVPGARIAANREIEISGHTQRTRAAADGLSWYGSFADLLSEALTRPAIREEIARQFLAKAEALIPFEITSRIVAEIERGARDVEAAKHRHPGYAEAIAEAWARAIEEVIELLRKGAGPASAPSY